MYRIQDEPERFATQLGIKPDFRVQAINAPGPFLEALPKGLPPQADLVDNAGGGQATHLVLFWHQNLADLRALIEKRLASSLERLSSLWVVIPKKPVAEARLSDLLFQSVLDDVLPTGWVDNKTLTFSEDEYGICFVPRRRPQA